MAALRASIRPAYTGLARPPKRDSLTIRLPDGRLLGYAEYGRSNGPAIFYFHGSPSSRIEAAGLDRVAKAMGARVISVDRPGIGLSSLQRHRRVLDWPSDVSRLAERLKLQRYSVLGASGGCAYALACAQALPVHRVKGVGVLAGQAPWSIGRKGEDSGGRWNWNIWAWTPLWFLHHQLEEKLRLDRMKTQNWDTDILEAELLDLEYPLLGEEDTGKIERNRSEKRRWPIYKETSRQGAWGYAQEIKLMTKSWGFQLEDVRSHRVLLWNGTMDVNTPIYAAREMAQRLPRAVLTEVPGATHHSPFDTKSILRALL